MNIPARSPRKIFLTAEARFQWTSFIVYLCILIPIACFIAFYKLGDRSFGVPDEVSHIQATQGMVLTGDFFQPTIGKVRYFNKPPLKMWLSLIPVYFLGESNFSYRLLDGLLGCCSALFVYSLGYILFRSWAVGFFAALSLLGCRSYVFTHGIRTAVQDGMLMTLTTLVMLLSWLLIREYFVTNTAHRGQRSRWLLAFSIGTTVGCAVYTKTVAGFLGLMILGVFLLISGKVITIVREFFREWLTVAILAISIPATYFAPKLLFTKGAAQVMLGHEVIQRATEGLHNQHNIFFYITRLFPDRAAVPPELLCIALAYASYLFFRERNFAFLYLIVWALFPLIFFTFIPSRLTWYIAPSFPAMALLIGFLTVTICSSAIRNFRHWLSGAQVPAKVLIPLMVGAMYCIAAISFHLVLVAKAVAITYPRNAVDLVVEQLLQLTPDTPILSFDEPTYSYKEQAYRNMLERRIIKMQSLDDLLVQVHELNHGIILTDAKNFYALLPKVPIKQYRFFRPKKERKQWMALIVFGERLPISPIRDIDFTVRFSDPNFSRLFGFGEPVVTGADTVRMGEGAEHAFLLEADWPHYRLGATMNLSGIVRRPGMAMSVFINSHQVVSEVKLNTGKQEIVWTVPDHLLRRGQNVVQFHIFDPTQTSNEDAKDLIAYNQLTVSLPR